VALLILTEGRIVLFAAPLLTLVPVLRRVRSMFAGAGGPVPGQTSSAETPFLRMSLNHDTGAMTGTVLRGGFAGLRLDELGRTQLLDLLRECRAADEEGARLLEAYLDRTDPDWRDRVHKHPPRGSAEMTAEEAYAVLGLSPGADETAIRAAHRRLMQQMHPDRGGSDYLATQINRARDVLLKR